MDWTTRVRAELERLASEVAAGRCQDTLERSVSLQGGLSLAVSINHERRTVTLVGWGWRGWDDAHPGC